MPANTTVQENINNSEALPVFKSACAVVKSRNLFHLHGRPLHNTCEKRIRSQETSLSFPYIRGQQPICQCPRAIVGWAAGLAMDWLRQDTCEVRVKFYCMIPCFRTKKHSGTAGRRARLKSAGQVLPRRVIRTSRMIFCEGRLQERICRGDTASRHKEFSSSVWYRINQLGVDSEESRQCPPIERKTEALIGQLSFCSFVVLMPQYMTFQVDLHRCGKIRSHGI